MSAVLVKTLKEAGEDHEWYPTTPEIIAEVKKTADRHHCRSALDIGAGRGDVLYSLRDSVDQLYAIEKSRVHIENYKPEVIVIGTDFHYQTLIDKKVDLIYCNPPYSEYEIWASKIIKEANAGHVLILIPDRWKQSEMIRFAKESRDATIISLGEYDFANAERSARCRVELLSITYPHRHDDPFSTWFDETFKQDLEEGKAASDVEKGIPFKERLDGQVAKGRNLIETLAEMYREELDRTVNLYRAICKMDPVLLKQVGIEVGLVQNSLQSKIEGLKHKYWQELFDNMTKITSRLTKKSRSIMLEKLFSHNNLDFTEENAYSVVIWAVKNANAYYDEQLVELYRRLSNESSAKPYKSNRHWQDASFRFGRGDDKDNYILDYRIVHYAYCYSDWDLDMWKKYKSSLTLQDRAHDVLNDICAVGSNLGFTVAQDSRQWEWVPGEEYVFNHSTRECCEEFMRVKAHKNGNFHLKINQKFMMRFNVEAARILGWVHSPKEAAEEMGYPLDEVQAVYNTSFRIEMGSVGLLPQPKIEEEERPF